MNKIEVNIVSAEGEIFSGFATMVFAPAQMGEIGIAPRHAPLLTGLKPGEVRVEQDLARRSEIRPSHTHDLHRPPMARCPSSD